VNWAFILAAHGARRSDEGWSGASARDVMRESRVHLHQRHLSQAYIFFLFCLLLLGYAIHCLSSFFHQI
jgi:hypothetical protein